MKTQLILTLAVFASACSTHGGRMKNLDQKNEFVSAGLQQEQTIYNQMRAMYCDTEKTRYFGTGYRSYIIVCEDGSRFSIPVVKVKGG